MTEDMWLENNTNGDIYMNVGDLITEEEYYSLLDQCDHNGDHDLSFCEIHDCLVADENEWREANCPPEFGKAHCPCKERERCPTAWSCEDIEIFSREFASNYSSFGYLYQD